MTESEPRVLLRVILGDANVLYSRVLRDYLLYAMTHGLIRVVWSKAILDEIVMHLKANIDSFDDESAARLVFAMNHTFPNSQVEPTEDAAATVDALELPDDRDRHVLVAAVSAEADILCTDNIKHFPPDVMTAVGIEALTADSLLSLLVHEHGQHMLSVHHGGRSLPGSH